MALLFRLGARPDAAQVRALAASGGFAVVHEPAVDDAAVNWLELLINGVSFDLVGLAGGQAAETPAPRHRFALDSGEEPGVEAVALVPGPHLAGGEAMLPVVRSQLALALCLAGLPGLVGIAWETAQSWMEVGYFTRSISAWLEGGVFPALGLTAVVPAFDGALHSEGLAFFTGQELRLEPELAQDRAATTKLAVRLLNKLVGQPPVAARYAFAGPAGEPLALEPSPNGRFVRVWPNA